jgi:hypothetical protein
MSALSPKRIALEDPTAEESVLRFKTGPFVKKEIEGRRSVSLEITDRKPRMLTFQTAARLSDHLESSPIPNSRPLEAASNLHSPDVHLRLQISLLGQEMEKAVVTWRHAP